MKHYLIGIEATPRDGASFRIRYVERETSKRRAIALLKTKLAKKKIGTYGEVASCTIDPNTGHEVYLRRVFECVRERAA